MTPSFPTQLLLHSIVALPGALGAPNDIGAPESLPSPPPLKKGESKRVKLPWRETHCSKNLHVYTPAKGLSLLE